MDMHAFLITGKRWYLLPCPGYAICGKNEGKNFKSEKSQDYAQKPQQNCKGGGEGSEPVQQQITEY